MEYRKEKPSLFSFVNSSMATTPLMETRRLQKSYVSGEVETPVLYDIDLLIRSGEFVAIMGPSGSGKSTLMHILGFLDAPSAGEYLFQGKPVSLLDDDALAGIRATNVSFVFQSFNLLPRTTVLENVLLPLLYHPTIPVMERESRARRVIEQVGLTERITHRSNQLSGGEQQRVAIARALVTEPEVIFADEPTGNLDSASGKVILALLKALHSSGHTIILVTHDRLTAENAQRIIEIRDGRIVSDAKHASH